MSSKIFVAVFAIFIQTLTAQSIGKYNAGLYGMRAVNPPEAYVPYGIPPNMPQNYAPANYVPANYPPRAKQLAYDGQGLSLASLSASNTCGVRITSSSPITPSGVFLQSEKMVIEGPLAVNGQLPFLGTITLEGALPAHGAGDVMYGCGNGNIGILNEEFPSLAAPGYPALGPYPRGPFPLNSLPPVARAA